MRKSLTLTFFLALVSLNAQAQFLDFFGFGPSEGQQQEQQDSPLKLAYDVRFDYYFDNREYDSSENAYSSSMTINEMRLSPSIGFDYLQSRELSHRVMIGIDIRKSMGGNPTEDTGSNQWNWDMFEEITAYYRLNYQTGSTRIRAYFGVIPLYLREGEYNQAFLSDSLKFYKNNLDGLLLQAHRPKAVYELGLDWVGKIDTDRREQFQVFSYGKGAILGDLLYAGWTFNLQHYANTLEYKGVVDNILAEPFVTAELGRRLGLQKLSLQISAMFGMQQDRRLDSGWDCPFGGRLQVGVMNWSLGLENSFYFGTSLMPYYNEEDDGGYKYGSSLYWGEPFYRIHRYSDQCSWKKAGAYDRIEAFWQPDISQGVKLRVSVVGHIVGDYQWFGVAGWQQKISLSFSLEDLLHPKVKKADSPTGSRTRNGRKPKTTIDNSMKQYL